MPSIDRILDVTESGAFLSVKDGILDFRSDVYNEYMHPDRLCAVIAGSRSMTVTIPALDFLAKNMIPLVICGVDMMPSGMLLPLIGHHKQSLIMLKQSQCPLPAKKRAWSLVIKSKIEMQGQALVLAAGDDYGLMDMARGVRSDDQSNMEAVAARKYWTRMFGSEFVRERSGKDCINRNLNYGYAVLRAMVNRAVCAAGMHPGLGVHHHNQYDPFPLGNDLMEPFRPIVDICVKRLGGMDLCKDGKREILMALTGKIQANGNRLVMELIFDAAQSLSAMFQDGSDFRLQKMVLE